MGRPAAQRLALPQTPSYAIAGCREHNSQRPVACRYLVERKGGGGEPELRGEGYLTVPVHHDGGVI